MNMEQSHFDDSATPLGDSQGSTIPLPPVFKHTEEHAENRPRRSRQSRERTEIARQFKSLKFIMKYTVQEVQEVQEGPASESMPEWQVCGSRSSTARKAWLAKMEAKYGCCTCPPQHTPGVRDSRNSFAPARSPLKHYRYVASDLRDEHELLTVDDRSVSSAPSPLPLRPPPGLTTEDILERKPKNIFKAFKKQPIIAPSLSLESPATDSSLDSSVVKTAPPNTSRKRNRLSKRYNSKPEGQGSLVTSYTVSLSSRRYTKLSNSEPGINLTQPLVRVPSRSCYTSSSQPNHRYIQTYIPSTLGVPSTRKTYERGVRDDNIDEEDDDDDDDYPEALALSPPPSPPMTSQGHTSDSPSTEADIEDLESLVEANPSTISLFPISPIRAPSPERTTPSLTSSPIDSTDKCDAPARSDSLYRRPAPLLETSLPFRPLPPQDRRPEGLQSPPRSAISRNNTPTAAHNDNEFEDVVETVWQHGYQRNVGMEWDIERERERQEALSAEMLRAKRARKMRGEM